MAEIRPFRALRFTPEAGKIEELTCPPYDIISESQRQAYLARNPHNIVRLELPATGRIRIGRRGTPCAAGLRKASFVRTISRRCMSMKSNFSLDGPSDISGMSGGGRSVMGLIGLVKLEEFEKGIILPHEETSPRPRPTGLI